MALKAIYERFLISPNPINLAENASLHYVTTLTSFTQSGPVVRHLESQNKDVVKNKSLKTIGTVEGVSSIAVEVEATLEFVSGGGAYMPGVDSFVVMDKTVTLPTTHIVHFNSQQKITQIRISWDQATLLKQVDIIGSRGRGWPVFDGKEQVKIITNNSVTAAPSLANRSAKVTPPTSPRGRNSAEDGYVARDASPSKRYIKDPHASLDLSAEHRYEENVPMAAPNPVAPRASAKPAEREMSDLFAAGHEDYEPRPELGGSPKKVVKHEAVAPKAGARNFQASRLFDEDEAFKNPKIYKTNPARYNHFDLGDAIDNDSFQHNPQSNRENASIPTRAKTGKHTSQWDFQDFVTPAKIPQKLRDQDVVHISWNEEDAKAQGVEKAVGPKSRRDAEKHFDFVDSGTPPEHHAIAKPRKDAQTHFEFDDNATPATQRVIGRTAAAKGLYRNFLDEIGGDVPLDNQGKKPLATITNNINRKNEFDNHWNVSDATGDHTTQNENNKTTGNHNKAVKMMSSHWDMVDDSPAGDRKPVGKPRAGQQSSWNIGDY